MSPTTRRVMAFPGFHPERDAAGSLDDVLVRDDQTVTVDYITRASPSLATTWTTLGSALSTCRAMDAPEDNRLPSTFASVVSSWSDEGCDRRRRSGGLYGQWGGFGSRFRLATGQAQGQDYEPETGGESDSRGAPLAARN